LYKRNGLTAVYVREVWGVLVSVTYLVCHDRDVFTIDLKKEI
jgi:hypothetical protein